MFWGRSGLTMRYQLTKEDRQKGFRAAVLKVREKHGLEFNEAVQWLMRKISPRGDWVAIREQRARIYNNLKGGEQSGRENL